MSVASVYENGGIIGQTLDFGSTEYYQEVQTTQNNSFTIHATATANDEPRDDPNSPITIPSTVQDGDLLVVACGHRDNPISEANMASGWTVLANSDDNSDGTPGVQSVILYKIATASDASTVFHLHTNSNDNTEIDYKLFVIRPDDAAITSGTTFTTGEDSYKTFNNPPQLSVNPSGSSGPVFAIAAYAVNTGSQPSASPTPTGNDAVDNTDFYVSHWVYSRADTKPSSITWDAGDGGRNAVSLAYIEIPDATTSVNKNLKNSGIWNLNAVFDYLASITIDFDVVYGGSSITTGTRSVSYPSTVNAGDLLIVTGSQANSLNTVPTGWNSHRNEAYDFCYSKVATGSETGSLSITTASGVEGVAQLILIRPQGAVLTDFFQSHDGAFDADGSLSYTAPASAGDFDLYLLDLWNAATRTLSTSPSNMNLISTTNSTQRADFYEAKNIGGETVSTSYTNSINWRSRHFAFITNGHVSSINRINLVADPLDMNAGFFTDGTRCTLSRDTTTAKSPLGGVPVKLETNGSADPFIRTYNASQYNIDTAANGETWEVRVLSKASTPTDIAIFIFGVGTNGVFINDATAFTGEAFDVGTEWQEFRKRFTFSNASVARVQSRLDGPQAGTSGISVWFDGFQIYKVS